jgi:voltage-gated potassium channel
MGTTIPLFLVVFSTTHYLLNELDPGSYSEPMTRFDALYFHHDNVRDGGLR